jgi:hypothetical protein
MGSAGQLLINGLLVITRQTGTRITGYQVKMSHPLQFCAKMRSIQNPMLVACHDSRPTTADS